jgi:hypothetical protein
MFRKGGQARLAERVRVGVQTIEALEEGITGYTFFPGQVVNILAIRERDQKALISFDQIDPFRFPVTQVDWYQLEEV